MYVYFLGPKILTEIETLKAKLKKGARGVALVPSGQNSITPKPKTNEQHARAPCAKFMIEAFLMTTLILWMWNFSNILHKQDSQTRGKRDNRKNFGNKLGMEDVLHSFWNKLSVFVQLSTHTNTQKGYFWRFFLLKILPES